MKPKASKKGKTKKSGAAKRAASRSKATKARAKLNARGAEQQAGSAASAELGPASFDAGSSIHSDDDGGGDDDDNVGDGGGGAGTRSDSEGDSTEGSDDVDESLEADVHARVQAHAQEARQARADAEAEGEQSPARGGAARGRAGPSSDDDDDSENISPGATMGPAPVLSATARAAASAAATRKLRGLKAALGGGDSTARQRDLGAPSRSPSIASDDSKRSLRGRRAHDSDDADSPASVGLGVEAIGHMGDALQRLQDAAAGRRSRVPVFDTSDDSHLEDPTAAAAIARSRARARAGGRFAEFASPSPSPSISPGTATPVTAGAGSTPSTAGSGGGGTPTGSTADSAAMLSHIDGMLAQVMGAPVAPKHAKKKKTAGTKAKPHKAGSTTKPTTGKPGKPGKAKTTTAPREPAARAVATHASATPQEPLYVGGGGHGGPASPPLVSVTRGGPPRASGARAPHGGSGDEGGKAVGNVAEVDPLALAAARSEHDAGSGLTPASHSRVSPPPDGGGAGSGLRASGSVGGAPRTRRFQPSRHGSVPLDATGTALDPSKSPEPIPVTPDDAGQGSSSGSTGHVRAASAAVAPLRTPSTEPVGDAPRLSRVLGSGTAEHGAAVGSGGAAAPATSSAHAASTTVAGTEDGSPLSAALRSVDRDPVASYFSTSRRSSADRVTAHASALGAGALEQALKAQLDSQAVEIASLRKDLGERELQVLELQSDKVRAVAVSKETNQEKAKVVAARDAEIASLKERLELLSLDRASTPTDTARPQDVADIARLNAEVRALRSRLRSTVSEAMEYRARLEELRESEAVDGGGKDAAVQNAHALLSVRDREMFELKQQLRAANTTTRTMDERIAGFQAREVEWKDRVRAAEAEAQRAAQLRDDANHDAEESAEDLRAARDREASVSAALEGHNATLGQMREALRTAQQETATWKRHADSNMRDHEELQARVQELDRLNAGLKSQVAALSAKADSAAALSAEVRQMEDLASEWRIKCEAAEAKLADEARGRATDAQTAAAEAAALRESLAARNRDIAALREDLDFASSALANPAIAAGVPSSGVSSDIGGSSGSGRGGASAAALQTDLDRAMRDLTRNASRVAELEVSLDAVCRERDDLRAAVTAANDARDVAFAQVDRMRREQHGQRASAARAGAGAGDGASGDGAGHDADAGASGADSAGLGGGGSVEGSATTDVDMSMRARIAALDSGSDAEDCATPGGDGDSDVVRRAPPGHPESTAEARATIARLENEVNEQSVLLGNALDKCGAITDATAALVTLVQDHLDGKPLTMDSLMESPPPRTSSARRWRLRDGTGAGGPGIDLEAQRRDASEITSRVDTTLWDVSGVRSRIADAYAEGAGGGDCRVQ